MAFNNTYNHQFISKADYEGAIRNFTKPGGCKALIEESRELATIGDPHFSGNNLTVNELCEGALAYCGAYAIPWFAGVGGRNAFDLAQTLPDPCPYYVPARNYPNQASIQQQLGVPLNFSYDAPVVSPNFGPSATLSSGTGDSVRIPGVDTVSSILKAGIKVAMVFGDVSKVPQAPIIISDNLSSATIAATGLQVKRSHMDSPGHNHPSTHQPGTKLWWIPLAIASRPSRSRSGSFRSPGSSMRAIQCPRTQLRLFIPFSSGFCWAWMYLRVSRLLVEAARMLPRAPRAAGAGRTSCRQSLQTRVWWQANFSRRTRSISV